ncbi:insulinase family protein, partial [Pseudomonas syringae pv. tagetis]
MAKLNLTSEEFSSEIEVFKEERRLSTVDKQIGKAFERFMAMAYPSSGYHTPTIHWMAHQKRMKVEQLRHWYESCYT